MLRCFYSKSNLNNPDNPTFIFKDGWGTKDNSVFNAGRLLIHEKMLSVLGQYNAPIYGSAHLAFLTLCSKSGMKALNQKRK